MIDFTAAFKQGQKAAQQAFDARAEISSVLKDMFDEIIKTTNGLIEISIIEFSSPIEKLASTVALLGSETLKPTHKKSEWIGARNPKSFDNQFYKIAKWEQPHEGYPCTITYNNNDVRCHDAEGLKQALAGMLADSWVGDQLRHLIEKPLNDLSSSTD